MLEQHTSTLTARLVDIRARLYVLGKHRAQLEKDEAAVENALAALQQLQTPEAAPEA